MSLRKAVCVTGDGFIFEGRNLPGFRRKPLRNRLRTGYVFLFASVNAHLGNALIGISSLDASAGEPRPSRIPRPRSWGQCRGRKRLVKEFRPFGDRGQEHSYAPFRGPLNVLSRSTNMI
jgi:hypothetical protein